MSFSSLIEHNRRQLVFDVFRRIEKFLEPFEANLDTFLVTMLASQLPADWREQWHAFIAEQEAEGFTVLPESVRQLEAWIESQAKRRGLLADVDAQQFLRSTKESDRRSPFVFATAASVIPPSMLLAAAPTPSGPSGRLPKTGGTWQGKPGDGVWKPSQPFKLSDGTMIKEVVYRDGMPVFDKWSKGEVTIAITGQNKFDRAQALRDWQAKGGGKIPPECVFHHDGLITDTIKYKGNDVFVGRMQLIPEELNNEFPHIGSASKARRFGGADKQLARRLADEVNELAAKGKGPLLKFAKRFRSLLPKVAKKVGRIIPLVGGVLLIFDFAENVEAHGIGGAVIRATPLLGDLVTMYDMAHDFGDDVKTAAEENARATQDAMNAKVKSAHEVAAAITVQVFRDLAAKIRVTNEYFDAQALREPIEEFYHTCFVLVNLRSEERGTSYPDDATGDEKSKESAFNVKLRRAREKLEKGILERTQQAPKSAEQGDAS
jgi:hypothetical protein